VDLNFLPRLYEKCKIAWQWHVLSLRSVASSGNMSDTDRPHENASLTDQYERGHITSKPCISCTMKCIRVATTFQINLETLGMSECHCTFETHRESAQYFVANVMLKGWKICYVLDIWCLLVSLQHTVKWTAFKRAIYVLIVWENFDTKLF
jgi:hypothetical protein